VTTSAPGGGAPTTSGPTLRRNRGHLKHVPKMSQTCPKAKAPQKETPRNRE
jgi:hypothetical protein